MDNVRNFPGTSVRELAIAGALLILFVTFSWGVAATAATVLPENVAATLRLDAKAIPVGMALSMTLWGLTAIVGEALCRSHSAKHLAIGAAVVVVAVATWVWMAGVLQPTLGGRLLTLPAFLIAVISVVTGLWMFCKPTIEEQTMSQRIQRLSIRAVSIVAIVVAVLAPLDLWARIAIAIGVPMSAALVDVALNRAK